MSLIQLFNENAKTYANKPILADDTVSKGLTYGKVDEIAGKVFSYLQAKGVGKDDFVMICLPRGVKPIIAMFGVWKNGSAFVLVEDNYAPERIEYIKTNCNCKLVIDADAWQEIQGYEYKAGFIPTDEHDAAFAVYTSGTTGNPKGVLHEYGNLDRMLDSVTMRSCEELARPDDRFALVAPLNFVASMLIILYGLSHAIFNYVVPYKTLKNPLLVGMFIMMNKITGTFLTPSHIRRLGEKVRDLGLRFCIVGSEPANEIYVDGLLIHNFYLMSESGFAVTHFLIDKKYEKTPVGNSEFGHEIKLLDEEGKEVGVGEEGEICFENKYVRGYINLPEETAKNFRDGMYHTGDLATKDELGRLTICGRLSDMVKVNGNRVEPGEIENVAKKVLKVDWTAARIFDDGKKVFIALYYTAKIKIDEEKTRIEMEKYLPYYMIPSFFIHIDSVPLRPNGKMDRKALPAPNFDDYKATYVEPRDEVEKALCEAFSKVLGIDRIGIEDDFYSLGGDSLGSMDVIGMANLPNLSVSHIFRGHTAEKIAQIYKEEAMSSDGVSIEEANKKALEKPQPLSPEQVYMMDYQMYTPKSTMYNLYQMMKFDTKVIDMEKLAQAVKTSAFNHPAILTTFFFNEDGDAMQKYSPELWQDIKVEEISESELNHIKDSLVKPFIMVNRLLFRCRIFKTPEAGYLFMDVHHTLFDGTSSKVFFGDILKAYFEQPLDPDYYYYTLVKRQKLTESKFYQESKEYFAKKYDSEGIKWCKYPTIDHESRENKDNEIMMPIGVEKEAYEAFLKKHNMSPNGFFITANILATAFYNKCKNIMVSWIYNGRNDANEMATAGLLFRNLPVAIKLNAKTLMNGIYADVTDQINKGIEHSCYPAVELNRNAVTDDMECVLYQDDLREIGDMPGLLGEVEIQNANAASQNVLDLEILNTAEGLVVMLDYASARYDEGSMMLYGKIMCSVCAAMVNSSNKDKVTVTNILHEVYKINKLGNFFKRLTAFNWLK